MPIASSVATRSSVGWASVSVDPLLAGGRLPDLGEVVPHVLRVEQPGDVAHPRADQVGPGRCDAEDETTAPVVTDEVDRFADRLQLADEPVDVLLLRRLEAVGSRHAEARQLQGDDIVAVEVLTERIPHRRCLRIAVDENSGAHAPQATSHLVNVCGPEAPQVARTCSGQAVPGHLAGLLLAGRRERRRRARERMCRLLEGDAQRLELGDQFVDVVAEQLAVAAADADLDGAGDELVVAGVEQAEPIAAVLRQALEPFGGRQLRLRGRRSFRPGRPTARRRPTWRAARRARARRRRCRSGRRLRTTSWPRRAIRQLSSIPSSRRAESCSSRVRVGPGAIEVDDALEPPGRVLRRGDVRAPRLAERRRLDLLAGRLIAACRPAPVPPTPRAHARRGDDRQPDRQRHRGAGAEQDDAERRHHRLGGALGEEPVAEGELRHRRPVVRSWRSRRRTPCRSSPDCWSRSGRRWWPGPSSAAG